MDAAIAEIRSRHAHRITSVTNGVRPTRVFRNVNALRIGDRFRMLSPFKKSWKRVKVTSVHSNGYIVAFEHGGTVSWLFFKRLLQYSAERSKDRPVGGDSGSALVNDENEVVGMHFAGDESNNVGFAMLAHDIFWPSTFGVTISLEREH